MIRIGIDPGVRMCGVAIEWERTSDKFAVRQNVRTAFLARALVDQKPDPLLGPGLSMTAQVLERLPSLPIPVGSQFALCVEGQQIYQSENAKGDPNDIVKLAVVAGVVAGALAAAFTIPGELLAYAMPLPRQWKGSVPKDVHHERLRTQHPEWIAPVEADTPKSMQHHVWDAVGLLIWHKERTNG